MRWQDLFNRASKDNSTPVLDPFGSTSSKDTPDPEPTYSYFDDVVIPMVEAFEKEVIAEQPAILAKMQRIRKEQFDGYDFSCIRHGDFLSLFMTRLANPPTPIRYSDLEVSYPQYFSTVINLSMVKTFRLINGRDPSLTKDLRYRLVSRLTEDITSAWRGVPSVTSPPDAGYEREVRGVEYDLRNNKGEFIEDESYTLVPTGRYSRDMRSGLIPGYVTPNCAEDGVDDTIVFSNGITIYVPFGKGKMVRQKILEALADGYKSAPISINEERN